MTTLTKRRRPHKRMISPLSERLFPTMREHLWAPWDYRTYPRHYSKIEDLKDFEDLFNEDFFEEDSLLPAMNIKEQDNKFEIELAVPGFSKKDFEISIEGSTLHITGETREEEETTDDDYRRKEFSYKSFKRSLSLPETIDLHQEIKAVYTNGILKLNLLKKELTEKDTKKLIEVI